MGKIMIPRVKGSGKDITNYRLTYISRNSKLPVTISIQANTKSAGWAILTKRKDFVKKVRNVY